MKLSAPLASLAVVLVILQHGDSRTIPDVIDVALEALGKDDKILKEYIALKVDTKVMIAALEDEQQARALLDKTKVAAGIFALLKHAILQALDVLIEETSNALGRGHPAAQRHQ